jgi:hypothetical protein
MKYSLLRAWGRWIVHAIELQMFIMVVFVPFCMAWGLPISPLAIVGNIIFTPFLLIILGACSLIFLCELFSIPHTLLHYPLSWATHCWQWIMGLFDTSVLIAYAKPPSVLFGLLCIGIFLLVQCSMRISPSIRIILYTTFLLALSGIQYCWNHTPYITSIAYQGKTAPVLCTSCATCLIDTGLLGSRANTLSFVQYNLVPLLMQQTGRTVLDHVVIAKPTSRTFQALVHLLYTIKVRTIYIPYFKDTPTDPLHTHFTQLHQCAHAHGCTLILIEQPTVCDLSSGTCVFLEPRGTYVRRNKIKYVPITITGQIDNTLFTFYSPQ